jgi:hypothetical protein
MNEKQTNRELENVTVLGQGGLLTELQEFVH